MSELIEKTRKSTYFTLPAQLITRVLGVGYVVLLARSLSVEEYGVYNFVVGALLVFGFLSNFGLASSLQRFLPEYSKLKKDSLLIKTIYFAHYFRTILGLLVLAIAIISFDSWSGQFGIEERKIEFILFTIGAFFLFQIEYLQIELNALFMHWATSIAQIIYSLLKFILVSVVFFYGFGLKEMLAAEAFSYLIGMLFAIYALIYHVILPLKKQREINKKEELEYKRLLRYSGYNAMVIPGNIMFSHSMDYFVIAAMASPYDLGIYALASRVSKMITSIMPQNILQSVIRPAFYHHYFAVEDKNKELEKMLNSLVRLIAAFLFPTVALVLVTAEPLITIVFGTEYTDAVTVFMVLVVFMLFTALEFPSDMVLQAIEKVEARLYAQIFAVYNVIAAIVLMNMYGIIGVAIATGTALMFKCLFFYYMANYYTGIKVDFWSLVRIGFNTCISALASYAVIKLDTTLPYFLLSLIVGASVYILMTYLNNFMNNNEKALVNSFVKRRVFNV
ncbi:MAG: oligosaccharide flippase family protein [Pseudomonadota bacterium]